MTNELNNDPVAELEAERQAQIEMFAHRAKSEADKPMRHYFEMRNELIDEFTALDREYHETIKPWLERYREAKADLADFFEGQPDYFQDSQGVVYKIVPCDGKFVYFDHYEIKRTRRDGERAGTLSMKEAREAGFVPYEPEKDK